jgi:hypothetical protein
VRALLAATLLALLTAAGAVADTKSGEAKLKEVKKGEDNDKVALKVSLGDKVKAETRWYIDPDFFGAKVLSAQATLKNTSDKKLHFGYYVAFFDKDKNLVCCTAFAGKFATLEPGKETTIGNVIELPAAQLARIASYQVTVLEDEKEFGK